ncbi:recombinase family protein [Dinoroseobacter sp. S76]|uniref:recombinase family protein n=1 Tax=Dinoroseobacter sp. S76 TaxID=3415124 RepID=UPI003C7D3D3A
MKQCFGYIRVSTQKQGEGASLEAQKDAITAFASQQGLSVIKWFEEKETAAKCGRPIFTSMIRRLHRGEAAGLIMHKIDRSARNMRDWNLIMELPKYGVKPYFAVDNLDFETRAGRLSANLQAVIAEDYIHNLREEAKKGLYARLKQGLYPFKAPIGYLDNGKGKVKTPDPKYAPMIRQMFELYASGQHSFRSLHEEMYRRGLRNTKGGRVSMAGIETIMNNPYYTGLIAIKRNGQTYQGIHEPIVPTSLFRRVQDIKAGKCGPKVTRHHHLFQGLFRCGLCDGPMSPELQKGRVYYRCQVKSCATKTIREDVLEAQVARRLTSLIIDEAEANRLEVAWCERQSEVDHAEAIKSLELRVADETTRLARLTDLLIDGTIDKDAYQLRERDGKLRLAELQKELATLPDPAAETAKHMQFLELMKSLAELYILAERDEKRAIVQNCFSNRTVSPKDVCLEPYDWLQRGKIAYPVLVGAHLRDADRTFLRLLYLLRAYKSVGRQD